MAKRARKTKQAKRASAARATARPATSAGAGSVFTSVTPARSAGPQSAAPHPAVAGSASTTRRGVRAQEMTLPPEISAIPLERVPHLLPDLRRIGITAAAMAALLGVAGLFLR